MGTIQVMSDLHLEFHRDGGEGFIRSLDPQNVDVLVLAGDITVGEQRAKTAIKRFFEQGYRKVLYVAGNHEFYSGKRKWFLAAMARLEAKLPGFKFMERGTVTLDGTTFHGTTLWFRDDPMNALYRHDLNDFHQIKDIDVWLYQENHFSVEFLKRSVRPGDVVITHHAPCSLSVGPEFRTSPLNCFYVCDMTRMMEANQPKLWIHGHMHHRSDYEVYDTRVVCNPLGYPGQALAFDEALHIDV